MRVKLTQESGWEVRGWAALPPALSNILAGCAPPRHAVLPRRSRMQQAVGIAEAAGSSDGSKARLFVGGEAWLAAVAGVGGVGAVAFSVEGKGLGGLFGLVLEGVWGFVL